MADDVADYQTHLALARNALAKESLYFFTRYMFLKRRGYKWLHNWHHEIICEALEQVYHGKSKRLIINVPPRYSKAIDCDTPMWTPEGWVPAGKIKIGDRLLGANGRWTTVVGVHPQGVKPAFDVRFSDGSGLVACGDHRWSVRLRDKSEKWTAPWQVQTTDQLRENLSEADGRNKWRIPVLEDTNGDDVALPIDPYLLGCWLGDGHSHYAAITTMDPEIIEAFKDFDPKPHTHQNAGRATTYGLRNNFSTRLRELGLLGFKHIPKQYMLGSHAQRLALLQGLCDTDGWVGAHNGQQGVCFSNKRLSDDVRSLVNSLGAVWRGFEAQPKRGKRSYKTFLSMPQGDVAFRLPRKLKRINPRSERNAPRRFLKSITPVEAREMVCFTVDAADSLFCAGRDFIVTHNTELAVINFTAWCQGLNPDSEFIHTSYSQRLAARNSWEAREIVANPEFKQIFPDFQGLRGDSSARDDWRTNQGGCVYAVGSGGTITGYGAGKERPGFGGAIIIDDPHKADEASSDVVRESVIEWFQNTLESRKNSRDTSIILIMQRLHERDLTGFLLDGGNGEKWDHICLPAITVENEALWPAKHTIEQLEIMKQAAPYVFAGQYMQQPTPPAGGTIMPDMIQIVDALPGDIDWVRAWDLAATEEAQGRDPDWTVGVLLGRHRNNGRHYISDVVRLRGRPHEVEAAIINTAHRDGPGVRISLPQDPGAAGKSMAVHLVGKLSGYDVSATPESGDKVQRANPMAAQINVGNFSMLRAEWNKDLVHEMRFFPKGAHDDQIDAASRAFMSFTENQANGLDYLRLLVAQRQQQQDRGIGANGR